MISNPSTLKQDDNPVQNVSWDLCQEFCSNCSKVGFPVQLPTEAQWEYACRAGSTEAYSGDLNEMAWFVDNSNGKLHLVRIKTPNAWGLFDMHGNLNEWCADCYTENYPNENVTDPVVDSGSGKRVIRGGSFDDNARNCRSAYRFSLEPKARNHNLGFRVVGLLPHDN